MKCSIHSEFDENCTQCKIIKSHAEKFPSIFQQGTNLAKALFKQTIQLFPQTNQDEYEERLQICEHCDRRSDNWRCLECGCFIESKAHLKTETCPHKDGDKWPKLMLPVIIKSQSCKSCGEKKDG